MKTFHDWNTFEELNDVDELLSNGATAEEVSFSLEDIMKEFSQSPSAETEAPAEEPVEEVPEEEPTTEPAEKLPEEESIVEPAAEIPEEEPVTEPVEEVPAEEIVEEPVEKVPEDEPEDVSVEETVEEPAKEAAEEEPQAAATGNPLMRLFAAVRKKEEAPKEPEAAEQQDTIRFSPEELRQEAEKVSEPAEPEDEPADNVIDFPVVPSDAAEESDDQNESVEETPAPDDRRSDGEEAETPAAEPEPALPEEPVDLSSTADFISQQVSEAMGPEEENGVDGNPFVSLFTDFRKKADARRYQHEQEKRERAAEAVAEVVEDTAQDKVLEMPVSKLKPIRDTVGAIQDKAHDFADHMWEQAAGPTEEEKLTDRLIPATDEERPAKSSHNRERKSRIPLPVFPDTDAAKLAKRYRTGLRSMGKRTIWMAVLTVVMMYFNLAADTILPLPAVLTEEPRILAAILTWLLGLDCAIGLDVIWMGLKAPRHGRPGMHTITSVAVIATVLDGLYYTIIGRDGPLPFASMAAFSLLCTMWGAYDRKQALHLACRSAAVASQPYRVTLDDNKWDGTGAFNKEQGTREGFGRQIQSLDGSERMYRLFVPVLLVAGTLGAVVASVGHGKPGLLLWCLSTIMVAGAPASGLLAFGMPYFRLNRRLDRSGAVLAGWDGVESMAGPANILIKDEDLFPAGNITLNSTTSFNDTSIEKLAGCAASMLRSAGSGLYHLFDDEIRRQGGFYRQVNELECYEAGGMTATIRGESVMIGTSGFMTVMRVPLEKGLRLQKAVLCVINNKLEGLFVLKYQLSEYARSSIDALIRAGVHPVLVTRDFNITPEMLRVQFDLPDDQMEYPPIRRRRELSEPDQPHNSVVGALLTREGMGAYSDAIVGGRRLLMVVRLNTILTILASVLGMVLAFYLTSMLAFGSLTPMNMMVFLLIWLIPTIAISGAVDRF